MSALPTYVAEVVERQRQRELEQRIKQLNALHSHREPDLRVDGQEADSRPRRVAPRRATAEGCD